MSNNLLQPFRSRRSLTSRGARLGLLTGLITLLLYILGFALVTSISAAITFQAPANALYGDPFVNSLSLAFLIILVGFCIGILPALVFGTLTGAIIGTLMQRFYSHFSKQRAFGVGMSVCILCTIPLLFMISTINDLLALLSMPTVSIDIDRGITTNTLILLGVPALLYISLGAIMSWRLYATTGQER